MLSVSPAEVVEAGAGLGSGAHSWPVLWVSGRTPSPCPRGAPSPAPTRALPQKPRRASPSRLCPMPACCPPGDLFVAVVRGPPSEVGDCRSPFFPLFHLLFHQVPSLVPMGAPGWQEEGCAAPHPAHSPCARVLL